MEASHQANQDCVGFQAELLANAGMSGFVWLKNIAIKPVRNHCALGPSVTTLFVLFCPSYAVVDYRGWATRQECSESNEA